jgi:cytochrome c oxidase cbb3-type subunit 3
MGGSRRQRLIAAAVAPLSLLVCLAGCKRETRSVEAPPLPDNGPVASLTELHPGGAVKASQDPRGKAYEGNAYQVAQGQRLYRWYNCSGCHFNGGGGIGPALMDSEWRYGGSIDQIYRSIYEGRPNGMPSFSKLPPQQIWQLAAYVRSLSSNIPPNAASSRSDSMASIPPTPQQSPQKPRPGDSTVPTGQ